MVVLLVTLVLSVVLRAGGAAILLPLLPVLPLGVIGWTRYRQQREQDRLMRCPKCGLRLSYRRLGPSHGMLECPAMCGYRRFVGRPGPPP